MKIAANGIRIHVKEQGSGDLPLVFLHYWGGSSRTWDSVIAALPQPFRTIATDLRGWGESDAPVTGYGLGDIADDAQGVIETLNLPRYVLVGHSMGGKVAQLLASRRPKGLVGLVLVAPSPPQPLAMPPEIRDIMANAYSTRETVIMALEQMMTAKALSPKDLEQVIEDSLRGAPQAKAAWPRSTSLEDITGEVAAINVPTIVIAGALDRVDSVDLLKAELLSRLPQAELHVLPGTGHLSPLESPREIAQLISDFAHSSAVAGESDAAGVRTAPKGTALITGASSGIGAIYAERLARRGYDLILVARNRERLDTLAARLADQTGRAVEVLAADLGNKTDRARVENRLRADPHVALLVNNAGIGAVAPLLASDIDKMEDMIALNVGALTRLTYAAVPGFVARGGGTIINIGSIVGIVPEILNGVYGGTKAFVLAFSQSLQHELADKNVRIQVVLPGAVATDFWGLAGTPVEELPSEIVMRADEMVDAALAGLDQGEVITIPSLPEIGDWQAYEAARQKLAPNLSLSTTAKRYRMRVSAAA
jgi:short-subunit dehydrogenase/pimeloyl-ACP methyl ester carboxylesterase